MREAFVQRFRIGWFLDFIFIPSCVAFLAYEPNAAHGLVDYLESGQYLSVINGFFHGKIPYKDIYLFFGPLTYYGPALAMLVFGKTLAVLNIYFMISNIIGFLMLYIVCRLMIKNRFFAYFAAILMVVESHWPFWSSRIAYSRWASAYASLLGLVLFCELNRSRFLFLAGLFASLAFLHSVDAGLLSYVTAVVFFVLYRQWIRAESNLFGSKRAVFSYLSGCAIVLVPFFIFLLLTQALDPFLRDMLSLGTRKVWTQPFSLSSRSVWKFFYPAASYLTALFLLWVIRFRVSARERIAFGTIAFFGLFLYLYSFRAASGPQFETAFSICVIVSFYLFWKIYDYLYTHPLRTQLRLKWISLVAVLIGGIAGLTFSQKMFYNGKLENWFWYQKHKAFLYPSYIGVNFAPHVYIDPSVERMKGTKVPEVQAQEIEEVVTYVRESTKPGDVLLGFPEFDFFNFLCDRPEASRFYISGFAWPKAEWQQEVLEAIQRLKPPLVLYGSSLSTLASSINLRHEILPDVVNYLRQHYRVEKIFGRIAILRLRD